MTMIRFSLLGRVYIETDKNSACKIEPHKAEELLVFLIMNRDRHHSREHLADTLWADSARVLSGNYLRKALWQLQSTLDKIARNGRELLHVDGEYLQVNPKYAIWLDTAIFEEACKRAQDISGRELDENEVRQLEQAEFLYRGELLTGWYQEWCLFERERFYHLYQGLLEKLMDNCESRGAYEKGLFYGEKILKYDTAHEPTHRRLMRMFYMAGDRTSALRQYHKCERVLQDELEVEPARSTRLLYEQIRADRLDHSLMPAHNDRDKYLRKGKERLRTVFSHLNALHMELNRMQEQIQQEMSAIQSNLLEE